MKRSVPNEENMENNAENSPNLDEIIQNEQKTKLINEESLPIKSRLDSVISRMLEMRSLKKKRPTIADQNLINELDLRSLLTPEDYLFYQEKKEQYIESYPDLNNNPMDLDDLHLMIMEQIMQRNLLRRKKKHAGVQIEDPYAASVKRQHDLKKSLSLRRTDRLKGSEPKKITVNIAQLGVVLQNEDEIKKKQIIMDMEIEEEKRLLGSKSDDI